MNFQAVQAVLNDLPPTFTKPTQPYTQVIDSQTSALTLYTQGADGIVSQSSFANVADWMDVWGVLFGVQRNTNEGNIPYAQRIVATLLAWVGTVPAIQAWIDLYAPGGSVVENDDGLGYVLNLPATLSRTALTNFLVSLGRIRPAGVPFTVQQVNTGLFLGTVNPLGGGAMPGSYLVRGATTVPADISALTNSSVPLLPDLYLTDPTLNPGI